MWSAWTAPTTCSTPYRPSASGWTPILTGHRQHGPPRTDHRYDRGRIEAGTALYAEAGVAVGDALLGRTPVAT